MERGFEYTLQLFKQALISHCLFTPQSYCVGVARRKHRTNPSVDKFRTDIIYCARLD